mmetsp:Transcript_116711/g.371322  ORF Transcript_116711/g.371322 Transcript_116711/m.371322 type:complete len:683 (-) Transcript_116711:231-2279(-)
MARKFVGSLLLLSASAQEFFDSERDACTSILVGRKASTDGSVMTSHSNDCADCDWRMSYVPARDYPEGATRTIFDGRDGAYPRLVDPARASNLVPAASVEKTNTTGKIPQVRHTFGMWESSYSLINDQGLALGESTCSAHLVGVGVPDGGEGLFAIRQLMAVALERCATARCAVQTMGDLGAQHGFYGEDPGKGGAGESVQLADALGEAWVFHISGGVPVKGAAADDKWRGQRGAMWAAQRVPDNHVAVVANDFIIRVVDPEDKENFMTHPGLFELTQEAGLWSGKGEFDFLTIMSPDIKTFSYNALLPPIPMYTTLRMWSVFRTVAPSLGIEITDDTRAFPFSVPVDKQLTHLDVMNLFRTHYEGTAFDMRLGALAGPFQSPNRIEGGRGMMAFPGQFARSPSISRTSYTMVGQTGPDIEAAVWFAPDCSASSVFVPFFARALTGDSAGQFDEAAFGQGSMKELSFTDGTPPAWWAFDFVANWMDLSYRNMSETYVYPKVQQLQREVAEHAAKAVLASRTGGGAAVLAKEQTRLQRRVTDEWWKFGTMLVVRYNDGFFNFGENAPTRVATIGYPPFWLEMIGYDGASYFPTWFERAPSFPTLLDAQDKSVAALAAQRRTEGPPTVPLFASALAAPGTALVGAALAVSAATFAAGLALGHRLGRRGASAREALESHYLKLGM